MTDIVERLRGPLDFWDAKSAALQAADEIARLRPIEVALQEVANCPDDTPAEHMRAIAMQALGEDPPP